MTETIRVSDHGRAIEFAVEDMMKYHGFGSPGGVATAFKVLQRAFGVLSPREPPPRRSIAIRTSFRGPGARDGFELVTRAVTGDRYTIDLALARPDRGRRLESFVFEVSIGDRSVTLLLREGFVTDEFIGLAGRDRRTDDEETRLDQLKAELARRLLAADAADVYDVAE
jgi:hypothetical protein